MLSSDRRALDIVQRWQQDGIPEQLYPVTRQTLWTGHPASLLRWVKSMNLSVTRKSAAS